MSLATRHSPLATHAFTLMEVLISIGVAAIGILGVLTLLPLAQHQAHQGLLEDRKAIAGRGAMSDLRVREGNRAQRWLAYSGGAWKQVASGGLPQANVPFCLDPLMLNNTPDVTLGGGNRLNQLSIERPVTDPFYSSPPFNVKAFPNSIVPSSIGPMPTDLRMARVTLDSTQGSGQGLPLGMAEDLCTDFSDLQFELPDDKSDLPRQKDMSGTTWATSTTAATGAPTRRQAAGNFSWFATFVPQGGTDLDLYVVSVVVCYRRRTNYATFPEAERVLNVTFAAPNEIVLTGFTDVAVDVRPGQWIMLSTQYSGTAIHKWYRIVQVEAETQGLGPFTRAVTIHGPDWQTTVWNGQTYATVVEGAVGVYEKLMRLESSSAWTPQ